TDATRERPLPACRRKFAATLAPERLASDYRGISDPVVSYKTSVSYFAFTNSNWDGPSALSRLQSEPLQCFPRVLTFPSRGNKVRDRVIRDAPSADLIDASGEVIGLPCSSMLVSYAWNQ